MDVEGSELPLNHGVSEDPAFYQSSMLCLEIGVRGGNSTPLSPSHFPLSLPLHLHPSLSLLLSSFHYSPSIPLLLLLALIIFCHLLSFSTTALSVPPPSLFASSPPSLSRLVLLPSSLTVLEQFTSHRVLTVTAVQPVFHLRAEAKAKAMMKHVSSIFYHLLVFCFQRCPIILMLN